MLQRRPNLLTSSPRSELAPTSHIAVFRDTLNLHNEFFHQPQLVPVFFPEMLFANVRSLFLPVLGFLIP
jgi:hypothetical protein